MRAKARDESVFRMLESERDRCARVIEKISAEMEKLPRGSLGQEGEEWREGVCLSLPEIPGRHPGQG